jgi:hypothetical protein
MSDPCKQAELEQILSDDIKTSFLLLFCEAQYNTENIHFVIAIKRYTTFFNNNHENFKWNSWESTDRMLQSDEPALVANELSQDTRKEIDIYMKYIYNHFLKKGSEEEICISNQILESTERRMKQYMFYGPEVFSEARLDPNNTLLKDILPRFLASNTYQEMKFYNDIIQNLPTAESLTIYPPLSRNILKSCEREDDIMAYCDNLNNYFYDPLLHNCFLLYLQRIFSSENLLCVSVINTFPQLFDKMPSNEINATHISGSSQNSFTSPEYSDIFSNAIMSSNKVSKRISDAYILFSSKDTTAANMYSEPIINQAWLIYLYFLAPGSCYEIGISHNDLKRVSQQMAFPSRDMFEDVRNSAMNMLKEHFAIFRRNRIMPEYKEMVHLLRNRWEMKTHCKNTLRTIADNGINAMKSVICTIS